MKKLLLPIIAFFAFAFCLSAQVTLGLPLIVPEFCNGIVKVYKTDNPTSILASHTLDLTTLVCGGAKPNCVAMKGNDIFVNVNVGCGRLYKFTDYATLGAGAASTQINNSASDYVGMAFDAAGKLYSAQGNYLDNNIVQFATTNGGDASVNLGNAGMISYFANITFDGAGNLWVSDYRNHRIVVFEQPAFTTYHNFSTLSTSIPVGNTIAGLNSNVNKLLSKPEGLAFDNSGNLWVGNNNDDGANTNGTLVKISTALQALILATAANGTYAPILAQANQADGYTIYNLPNPAIGTSNCFVSAAARSQCGGVLIDNTLGQIYINEQQGNKGFKFDLATIAGIPNNYNTNSISILSTNAGNGGIAFGANILAAPVELLTLEATYMQPNIRLTWKTATETNNKGFDIQRSKDGKSFENIGYARGNGTSVKPINYTFIDNSPNVGYNYYRLKQTDFDEKTTYSSIIAAKNKMTDWKFSPNPTNNGHINLTGIEEEASLNVINTVGAIVKNINLDKSEIDLSDLPSGLYILNVTTNSGNSTSKRIIIQ